MQRFLAKRFSASSRYSQVEANSSLEAAEKLTGLRLTDKGSGDVVALVQTTIANVVTTIPYYAIHAGQQIQTSSAGELSKPARAVVSEWFSGERVRLLKEIEEIENGTMRVQKITSRGPADVTTDFLMARRQQLANLGSVINSCAI